MYLVIKEVYNDIGDYAMDMDTVIVGLYLTLQQAKKACGVKDFEKDKSWQVSLNDNKEYGVGISPVLKNYKEGLTILKMEMGDCNIVVGGAMYAE